jgi:signal transduction histidine kinase
LGHPQWLEEVFANLISNAIKYRGDNNLSAQIHIHGHYHGDRVRYEVWDNGIGIKEDDIQKLFTMFSRLHTTQAMGLAWGCRSSTGLSIN